MKFLIIGGDAAGMSAASKAKRLNPDIDVTVLEMTQDVSYSACGMPYHIADPQRDMDELIVRKAEVFREKNKINLLTGHMATKIDPGAKCVEGVRLPGKEPFSFEYDKLLIATGAEPSKPAVPGIDHPDVMVLKNLEQGKRIRHHLDTHPVKTAAIMGMGYIALEMSEAFVKRGIHTILVKPGDTFLPWMKKDLADVVLEEVTSHGIEVHAGCKVNEIRKEEDGFHLVCDDQTLCADLLLVATGVNPLSRMASDAGLETGPSGAISVDEYLMTSDEHIYAAGDCADAINIITGKKSWIPLALRANRAGWAVADHLCGEPVALPGICGTSVFKVLDLEVARTGLNEKEAQTANFSPVEVTVKTRSMAHGQPGSTPIYVSMVADKTSDRLLGVQMVGKKGVAHRINAAAVALSAKMTVAQFFQTDLAYAPPFGPVWDPLLTAANQLLKKL